MKEKELVFFAYKGKYKGTSDENVDAIYHAIRTYNQYQKKYLLKSWEEYKKTTAINIDVLNAINNCSIFVSDLSYFNHNVLFELGYAIGKNKKILILLNTNVSGASDMYENSFLKNIRYTPLINSQDIQNALKSENFDGDLITKFVNISNIDRGSNDLLYIRSKIKNQPSLDLSDTIDMLVAEQGFSLIDDDTQEVSYRPMNWYFQNLVKSKCLVMHLLGENMENASLENANNSFLAGLACSLKLKVLLVAPSKYSAPLDYHDILIQYASSDDLINSVIEWINKALYDSIVEAKVEKKEKHELNLIKLGIGCEVAEREKDGLQNYFIETASYFAALNQEKSILVGRKGSGKSAIYIKIQQELANDKLSYIVDLKPESDELLEDVQLSKLFDSPVSKRSFFVSVWKLVIFSKLIASIYKRVKPKPEHSNQSHDNEIIKFVEENERFIKMNVFGVVSEIHSQLNKSPGKDSPDILFELYRVYLAPLIRCVKNYFSSINAKYYKIVILADNLDKTWDSKNDLEIQSELIITLFEIENKIKNELRDVRDQDISLRKVIFLRKDIFEYILKLVDEPDKWTTSSHEINWENYPKLLKQVIDNRFKYILGLNDDIDIEETWKEFFDMNGKKRPFQIIEDVITKRPRDAIYFVSRLFESAINNGNQKVGAQDLKYAIEIYTSFINKNLIAETKAEYPEIVEILSKLQEHHGKKLEYRKLKKILHSIGYNSQRQDAFIATLFEKDYMVGFDTATNSPFSDLDTLRAKLKEKRYFVFPNRVYVIAHAKYFFIKHRKFTSF